jgi:hypothetical protein
MPKKLLRRIRTTETDEIYECAADCAAELAALDAEAGLAGLPDDDQDEHFADDDEPGTGQLADGEVDDGEVDYEGQDR